MLYDNKTKKEEEMALESTRQSRVIDIRVDIKRREYEDPGQ